MTMVMNKQLCTDASLLVWVQFVDCSQHGLDLWPVLRVFSPAPEDEVLHVLALELISKLAFLYSRAENVVLAVRVCYLVDYL